MSDADEEDGRPRPYPRPPKTQQNPDEQGVPERDLDEVFPQYDGGKPIPGSQPASGSPPWEGPAHADALFNTASQEPIDPQSYPQIIEAPSWIKTQLYSLWYYIFIMGVISALTWLGWFKIGSPEPLKNWAIGITVVAAGMCLLRLVRGSMLDAEKEFEDNLRRKTAGTTVIDGFPVLDVVSNRIGRSLNRNPLKPPERVRWEGRQHFFSVFSVAARRFTKSSWMQRITKGLLKILVVVIVLYVIYQRQEDTPASVTNTLNGILGYIFLLIACYLAYGIVEWRLNRYAMTSTRLLGVVGILGKGVGSMPNNRFTDAQISTSVTSQVFAWLRIVNLPWSTWIVESAGQNQALERIRFITAGYIIGPFFNLGDTA